MNNKKKRGSWELKVDDVLLTVSDVQLTKNCGPVEGPVLKVHAHRHMAMWVGLRCGYIIYAGSNIGFVGEQFCCLKCGANPRKAGHLACLLLSSSHNAANCSTCLQKKSMHGRAIPSVANSQWLFHLSQQQQRFCHENYLVLARTQLFHHKYGFTNCHFPNVFIYVVSMYTESLLVLHKYSYLAQSRDCNFVHDFSWFVRYP